MTRFLFLSFTVVFYFNGCREEGAHGTLAELSACLAGETTVETNDDVFDLEALSHATAAPRLTTQPTKRAICNLQSAISNQEKQTPALWVEADRPSPASLSVRPLYYRPRPLVMHVK